jgi:hypothetical protein
MIDDRELRELVRAAVARRLVLGAPEERELAPDGPVGRQHSSHFLLPVPPGSEGDGACLIEPDVRCNHCGYCMSYGH